MLKQIKVFDLFAGYGGAEFALQKAGIPHECFRLMGFVNDEININGLSDSQLYKLAGNGWDINIASMLLSALLCDN